MKLIAVVVALAAVLVGNVGAAGEGTHGYGSQALPEQVLEQRLQDMQSVGDEVEKLAEQKDSVLV